MKLKEQRAGPFRAGPGPTLPLQVYRGQEGNTCLALPGWTVIQGDQGVGKGGKQVFTEDLLAGGGGVAGQVGAALVRRWIWGPDSRSPGCSRQEQSLSEISPGLMRLPTPKLLSSPHVTGDLTCLPEWLKGEAVLQTLFEPESYEAPLSSRRKCWYNAGTEMWGWGMS